MSSKSSECPACGVAIGKLHKVGCDVEQCPYCGGQVLSCCCGGNGLGFVPDDDRLPWTGLLPGAAECKALGWYAWPANGSWAPAAHPDLSPDLDRLHKEAKWDRETKRFVVPEDPRQDSSDTQNTNALKQAALDYAARGWPILTVAGKRAPLDDATTDPVTIEEWWTKNPKANVALRTGSRTGVFAVVVKNNTGRQTLATLQNEHGDLPKTPTATCGADLAYFFHIAQANIMPTVLGYCGLQLRGNGSWAMLPPSTNSKGQTWSWSVPPTDQALAAPPEWLIAFLLQARAKTDKEKATQKPKRC